MATQLAWALQCIWWGHRADPQSKLWWEDRKRQKLDSTFSLNCRDFFLKFQCNGIILSNINMTIPKIFEESLQWKTTIKANKREINNLDKKAHMLWEMLFYKNSSAFRVIEKMPHLWQKMIDNKIKNGQITKSTSFKIKSNKEDAKYKIVR